MTAPAVKRLAPRLACSPPEPRLLSLLLVVGYVVQVALRVAISVGRDGPTNLADETGYLANARVMSGGVAGELSMAAFYRGGYSLLLLPAYWLGDGSRTDYQYALATNALLSSLVFPLVYVLLTRVFRVPVRTALVAAFLAALYPPLVVTTQFAWAESLLPVLVLLVIITLAGLVTASRPRAAVGWAIACGSCAGALYTTHGRTAPMVALLLGLLVALALLRHDLAVSAVAGAVATVAVTLAGQALNNWLTARSWGQHHDSDLQRVLDNARDLGSLENVAALGLGQYWYLFVATFGLIVLGLVYLGTHLLPSDPLTRRLWPGWAASRDTAGAPVVGVFLAGSVIGLTVLAGLFLRPPVRPDHVVYGRYVEILIPPLLALGLVRLWTTPIRRLAPELGVGTAVALAAGVTVMWYRGGLVTRGPVNWYTVLALPPLAQTREQIRPATATLVALAGAAVLLVVTRRSPMWAALGLACVLVASSIALRVVLVEASDHAIYGTQPVALPRMEGLDSAQEVSYDIAAYTPIGLYSYQWQLGHARFLLFDSRRDPVPRTEWVIAGLDWSQAGTVGARRVWVHPAYRQGCGGYHTDKQR
ncbi:MAG TPA: hypothetical protein VFM91_03635 [Propionibacteriaceae bacterium]|nr:hypothetical protein [Propionibacteriaceae bacterium]